MKKLLLLCLCIVVLITTGCKMSTRDITTAAQKVSAELATQSVPIPIVSYFQERKTVAKWIQRWDKPSVASYIYLVSYGKILGYYVADGKPASTRSYLMPEDNVVYTGNGPVVISAPDIDGTYGTNNQGIRFFTAEGTAVEWGGGGASYIFADTPINFGYDVPKLNKK